MHQTALEILPFAGDSKISGMPLHACLNCQSLVLSSAGLLWRFAWQSPLRNAVLNSYSNHLATVLSERLPWRLASSATFYHDYVSLMTPTLIGLARGWPMLS